MKLPWWSRISRLNGILSWSLGVEAKKTASPCSNAYIFRCSRCCTDIVICVSARACAREITRDSALAFGNHKGECRNGEVEREEERERERERRAHTSRMKANVLACGMLVTVVFYGRTCVSLYLWCMQVQMGNVN